MRRVFAHQRVGGVLSLLRPPLRNSILSITHIQIRTTQDYKPVPSPSSSPTKISAQPVKAIPAAAAPTTSSGDGSEGKTESKWSKWWRIQLSWTSLFRGARVVAVGYCLYNVGFVWVVNSSPAHPSNDLVVWFSIQLHFFN
jgi:hypothetical protein